MSSGWAARKAPTTVIASRRPAWIGVTIAVLMFSGGADWPGAEEPALRMHASLLGSATVAPLTIELMRWSADAEPAGCESASHAPAGVAGDCFVRRASPGHSVWPPPTERPRTETQSNAQRNTRPVAARGLIAGVGREVSSVGLAAAGAATP